MYGKIVSRVLIEAKTLLEIEVATRDIFKLDSRKCGDDHYSPSRPKTKLRKETRGTSK